MSESFRHFRRVSAAGFCLALTLVALSVGAEDSYLSPTALAVDKEGKRLFVAEFDARQVAVLDLESGQVVKTIPILDRPGGLALARDGKRLYVAGASPQGVIHVIDVERGEAVGLVSAGHTPGGLVIDPDGKTLYAANRFTNDLSVIDLEAEEEIERLEMLREPVAAAVTPDGRFLYVANHLPIGSALEICVMSYVTVFDLETRKHVVDIGLPNGSINLRGICVSPDGRHVYVTHLLGRYQVPTTQLERGWISTNALSVISVEKQDWINTVLLDDVDRGAANPWDVVCTADGRFICVTHSGAHEVSVIDQAKLLEKLGEAARDKDTASNVRNDLAFLVGLRRRMKLAGVGPRGLAVAGSKLYAAEYFSGSVGVVDLAPDARHRPRSLALGNEKPPSLVRKGEALFHDARLCFQQWLSCASCHPDARSDGLNWDLLNDGMGNPKNSKSMLLSHQTPPVMATGVRPDAETAVRAGLRHIQFTVRPEEDAEAIDAYLKSLEPVPSPYLVDGRPSPAAQRGAKVFKRAGCAGCHSAPLFTDLERYCVGTGVGREDGLEFDTPTLVEAWRSAPYLYDGRAATIEEVLTRFNAEDRHGATSWLSAAELADLTEFVLSQ